MKLLKVTGTILDTERSSQTEQHEAQNQNDATKTNPKG